MAPLRSKSESINHSRNQRRPSVAPAKVRLNVPLVALTVSVASVLGPTLWWWHNHQVIRLSEMWLARADTFEKQSDWRSAAEHVHRYLQLHPAAGDARVRMAELYGKSLNDPKRIPRAIDLHYQALGYASPEKRFEMRLQLAKWLIDAERYPEALKQTEQLRSTIGSDVAAANTRWRELLQSAGAFLELEEPPGGYTERLQDRASPASQHLMNVLAAASRPEIQRLLAVAIYGRAMARETIDGRVGEELELAVLVNPEDVELAMTLAHLYREERQLLGARQRQIENPTRKADALIDAAVTRNHTSAEAHLARYRYRTTHALPGGRADLEAALRHDPNSLAALLAAAQHAQQQADRHHPQAVDETSKLHLEQAEVHYRRIIEQVDPASEAAYAGLGDVYHAQQRIDQAIATWQQGLEKAHSQSIALNARLTETLIHKGRLKEAERRMRDLMAAAEQQYRQLSQDARIKLANTVDSLKAGLMLARDEPREAVVLLEKVTSSWAETRDADSKYQVWVMLGQACAALARWDQAARVYQHAAHLRPRAVEPLLLAANAWRAGGQLRHATSDYQRALAVRESPDAWLALAEAQLRWQQSRLAPQRKWQPFLEALDRAEQMLLQEPGTPDRPWRLNLLRAEYEATRSETAADVQRSSAAITSAVAQLRQAEQQFPDSAELAGQLVLLYEKLGQPLRADRALTKLKEVEPKFASTWSVAARLHTLRGQRQQAHAALQTGLTSVSPDDRLLIQRAMIQSLVDQGNRPLARQELAALHKQYPQDDGIVRQLLAWCLEDGDFAAAVRWEEALQRCRSVDPQLAEYWTARRLLAEASGTDDSQFQQAARIQQDLSAQRPDWKQAWLLRGLVEQKRGRTGPAIEAYEKAVELGERRVEVFQRLFQLLLAAHRFAEAEQHLARLKQSPAVGHNADHLELALAAGQRNWQRAIAAARQAIEHRPDDPVAHVWLGQMLLMAEETESAEEAFRAAVAANESDVRAWNGLFSYYLRTEQLERAGQTLEQLVQKAEISAARKAFVAAQGYELLGNFEQAWPRYDEAARLAPDDVAVHMRRAAFYFRRDAGEAEQSLRQALSLSPQSEQARLGLATLLASKGDETAWSEAFQLLQSSEHDTHGSNQRLQTILLMQSGRREDLAAARKLAEEQVLEAATPDETDRLLLIRIYQREIALAQEAVLRQQLYRDLERQFAALVAQAPDSPSHLADYIDFLLQQNESAKARGWLSQLETRWTGSADAGWRELGDYAMFLIQRRFASEAAALLDRFRRSLEKADRAHPAAVARYVELCLRQSRLDEAAPWLDKLEKLAPTSVTTLDLRVRWFAAQGKSEGISAAISVYSREVLPQVSSPRERAELLRYLTTLCLRVGHFKRAEHWSRQYLRSTPDAYPLLALALSGQGRLPEAIELCAEAARRDSSPSAAIALTGVLMNAKPSASHWRQADRVFAATLEKHPANPELLHSIADVRLVQGRAEEAIAFYKKALQLIPRSTTLLNNLASLLASERGQADAAAQYIQRAVLIAGPQPTLYDTQATVLLHQGDASRAVELLETAVALDNDPRFRFHLAAAYHAVGADQKAGELLRLAANDGLIDQLLTSADQQLLQQLQAEFPLKPTSP